MIWSMPDITAGGQSALQRIATTLPQCADKLDLVLKLANPGPEDMCRKLQKYRAAFLEATPAISELQKHDDTNGLRLDNLHLEPEKYIEACREAIRAREEMLKRNDAKEMEAHAMKRKMDKRVEALAARLDCLSDRLDEWDSELFHTRTTVNWILAKLTITAHKIFFRLVKFHQENGREATHSDKPEEVYRSVHS